MSERAKGIHTCNKEEIEEERDKMTEEVAETEDARRFAEPDEKEGKVEDTHSLMMSCVSCLSVFFRSRSRVLSLSLSLSLSPVSSMLSVCWNEQYINMYMSVE